MSKASLMSDMDEFTLSALRAEVVERERRKAARVCTHCARDYWTVACKFPRRHNGTEF